jgi:NhaP-type Na+/H+ or K+/H+ antiporter
MLFVLVFAATLLIAVLVSERSNRTVLSSTVLFVAAGFLAGRGGFGILDLDLQGATVTRLSDLALFTILFTDGMKLGYGELRRAWRLPGRALFLGLPLTILGVAVVGHYLLGQRWRDAFLVGAILSPTDPVFASAIVGREEIPARLRHLLNVESGLNDGLALPIVIALVAIASDSPLDVWTGVKAAVGGLLLGAVTAVLGGKLRDLPFFAVAREYEPLHALAIGLLVLAAASTFHLNEFLAAFTAGVALATISPRASGDFHALGEQIGELLKLSAVLVFAATLSAPNPRLPWLDYVFAVLVLTFVRTVAIAVALVGSGLTRAERLVAAWFGPKGFASVLYGLMLLKSGVANGRALFDVIALVIVLSIVLHSSTDVPVAKYFARLSPSRD